MTDFTLYEVVASKVDNPEYRRTFKLAIDRDDVFDLYESDILCLREVLLERFPITETETRAFDKKRALKLVEEI